MPSLQEIAALAAKVTPPGPRLSATRAADLVSFLREQVPTARALTSQLTGLPSNTMAAVRVEVVDRPTWIRQLCLALGEVLADAPGKGRTLGLGSAAGFAAALVAASTRLTGHVDFTGTAPTVTVIAPNLATYEDDLRLDRYDFRRWVLIRHLALAAQFAAAPWLAERVTQRLREIFRHEARSHAAYSSLSLKAVFQTWRASQGAAEPPSRVRGPRGYTLLQPSADSNPSIPPTQTVEDAVAELTRLFALVSAYQNRALSEITHQQMESIGQLRSLPQLPSAVAEGVFQVVGNNPAFAALALNYDLARTWLKDVEAEGGVNLLNRMFAAPQNLPDALELVDSPRWIMRLEGKS